MSDKQGLLSENTVKRFMKLASIGAANAENFVNSRKKDNLNEMGDAAYAREDEEELAAEDPAMDADPELELDAAEMDEPLADEEDVVDAEDADLGAADMSLTEEEARVLIELGRRLQEVVPDEDMAPEDDMDAEPELDLAPEGEMDAEPEVDLDAAPEEEEEEPLNEELVNRVLRNVTKRLIKEKVGK